MHADSRSVFAAVAVLVAGVFSVQAQLAADLYHNSVGYNGSYPGSYEYNATTDVMTVTGCGEGVWGAADGFYYAYFTQSLDEDFDYIIKVSDFDGEASNKEKAGLMVHETTGELWNDDGSEVIGYEMDAGGRYFCLQTFRQTDPSYMRRGVQWRPVQGSAVTDDQTKRFTEATWPQWLRLRRVGDVYYGIASKDGVTWEKVWSVDTSDTETWTAGPLGSTSSGQAYPLAVGVFVSAENGSSNDAVLTASGLQAFPQTPVVLESELVGAEIMAGTDYRLSAKVSGYSPFTYTWRKDGKILASGTELFKTTFSYNIKAASITDGGTYTLEVMNWANGEQTILQSSAKVVVNRDSVAPTIESVQVIDQTVGITFSEPVDSITATKVANYSVTGTTIENVEQWVVDRVTLQLNGSIKVGSTVDVTVQNVKDLSGNAITNAITSSASASFAVANVGQAFSGGSALALGGDGFMINNQGLEGGGTYDEETFAYKKYTGDFDIRVRVLKQSTATPYARAGLQIRTALDEGAASPHSSYAEIHHTPIQAMDWNQSAEWYGTPYDNMQGVDVEDMRHAIFSDWRPTSGDITYTDGIVESFLYNDEIITPLDYVQEEDGELWIRIGRVGNVMNTYYGIESDEDGVVWTKTASNAVTDMGIVAYGGAYYEVIGNDFGACTSLTNEFMSPTVLFYASMVDWEEGMIEAVAVTKSPQNKTVKVANSFTLTVEGTGDPITYQWYKDGTPISGAIEASYTVSAAKLTDAGTYKCELMNFGSGAPDKGSSAMSEECTVTVVKDGDNPLVTSYGYDATTGVITIEYSETMDETSVSNSSNYIVKNSLEVQKTVTDLTVNDTLDTVTFMVSDLVPGDYTIILGTITNPAGKEVVYEPMSFTVEQQGKPVLNYQYELKEGVPTLTFSWLVSSGATLETASTLDRETWTEVPGTVVGDLYQVEITLDSTVPSAFYRLVQ